MPTTSVEAACQARYDALTSFADKPAVLWAGLVRLKLPSGVATTYPIIRFEHAGTGFFTTFTKNHFETFRFDFEIYAATRQQAKTIFDRVLYNGFPPDTAGANGGFWHATSLDLPSSYTLKAFHPVGEWRCQEVVSEWLGTSEVLNRLTWTQELVVERISWS